MNNIGARLKKRREELKYSQIQFAEVVGLSTNYISAIENGKKIPSLETFVNIANKLGVSADYFLVDVVDNCEPFIFHEITEVMKSLNIQETRIVSDVVKLLAENLIKNRHV